jgi:hypothetical protein
MVGIATGSAFALDPDQVDSIERIRSEPAYNGKPLGEWIRRLNHNDYGDRVEAAAYLGMLGRHSDAAVLPLIELLKNARTPDDRWMACVGLTLAGPAGRDAVPLLIEVLQDEDKGTACWGARALGSIGPEARVALPTLQKIDKGYSDFIFCPFGKGQTAESGAKGRLRFDVQQAIKRISLHE